MTASKIPEEAHIRFILPIGLGPSLILVSWIELTPSNAFT